MSTMFQTVLTFWYALTALAGSQLCCWVCCEPAPVEVVALSTPAIPFEKKACPHCCESEESVPASPVDSEQSHHPKKPSCPYCEQQLLSAQAAVSAAVLTIDDLLKVTASLLIAELPPQRPTIDLATLRDREGEPVGPFPSTYQLVNVFHMMRC